MRYALFHLTPSTAASANSITFAAGVSGQTISLAAADGGELAINQGVTILGLGLSQLAVSGSNTSRVFAVNVGINVSISGLTLRNGQTTGTFGGGAVINSGALS